MKKLLLVPLSLILFSGCAKKTEDVYLMRTIQPNQQKQATQTTQKLPRTNQYDAYVAQANTIKNSNIYDSQARANEKLLELEYKYKVILEKEETKRVGIESSNKKKKKRGKYVLPKICNEESAKKDDSKKDEVCAALREMHDSLQDEYGEPEDYSGGIVINAQGASDFAINVQSHGNTNEGRKSQLIQKPKSNIPMYAKRPLMPAIPQPPKGFWESFSDNLFGSFDNVVDKAANIVNENADVMALGYVGGKLAKKPTTEIRGDLIGGDNNAYRNDWEYEYTGTSEEASIEE